MHTSSESLSLTVTLCVQVRFVTKVLHPNIDKDTGEVSLGLDWSPAFVLAKYILSVVALLDDPNFDSPVNAELARLHADEPAEYERMVKAFTQKHAK